MSTPRKPRRTSAELSSRRDMIRKLIALPAAFTLMPLDLQGRSKPHEHVVGMAAEPPCPPDWIYIGDLVVRGVRYCVYLDAEGLMHAVKCDG